MLAAVEGRVFRHPVQLVHQRRLELLLGRLQGNERLLLCLVGLLDHHRAAEGAHVLGLFLDLLEGGHLLLVGRQQLQALVDGGAGLGGELAAQILGDRLRGIGAQRLRCRRHVLDAHAIAHRHGDLKCLRLDVGEAGGLKLALHVVGGAGRAGIAGDTGGDGGKSPDVAIQGIRIDSGGQFAVGLLGGWVQLLLSGRLGMNSEFRQREKNAGHAEETQNPEERVPWQAGALNVLHIRSFRHWAMRGLSRWELAMPSLRSARRGAGSLRAACGVRGRYWYRAARCELCLPSGSGCLLPGAAAAALQHPNGGLPRGGPHQ